MMVAGTILHIGHFGCLTVDCWTRSTENVLFAFLTHAHADHLHGLSETWTGKTAEETSENSKQILDVSDRLDTEMIQEHQFTAR